MGDTDDWVRIHQLEGLYGPRWDTADAKGWADLFTDDGEFVQVFDDPSRNIVHSGRAALEGFCTAINREWRALHMLHLPALTFDGDTAEAVIPFHCRLLHRVGTLNGDSHVFGVYRVEYVRTGAGWRIRRRQEQLAVTAGATWTEGIYGTGGLLNG